MSWRASMVARAHAMALEQLDRGHRVTGLVVRQAPLVGVGHADDRHAHAPLVGLERPAEVVVVDRVATVPDRMDDRLVDDVLDLGRGVVDRLGDHLIDRQVEVLDLGQVEVEDFAAAVVGRGADAQLAVETAWPQEGRVEHGHEVGRRDG